MNFLSTALLALLLSVSLPPKKSNEKTYDEKYRPQFHFSPEKNLMNSPSGLVFYNGEYHLFYRYNPAENENECTHWGHARSNDMLHWKHSPVALHPENNSNTEEKCTVLSGSVIIDKHNVLKKETGPDKTLVAFYTSKNCGQRIAFSTDKGQSWKKLENNPLIPTEEKDEAHNPKVIWHELSKKWIMTLNRNLTDDAKSKGVSFYTSDNLVDWKWESHVPGYVESADLIQFNVSNRPDEKIWALIDGDGSYLLGTFDGQTFSPASAKMKSDWGKNYFAIQTCSNLTQEKGRVVQIAWMKGGEYPDMPFSGQMTFPCELAVTKFKSGYKLVRKPISEVETLHGKGFVAENKNVIPGVNDNKLKKVSGDCLHIIGEFDLKTSNNFGLMLRHSNKEDGTELLYNVKRGTLNILGCTVPVPAVNNKIKLEILLDRSSIEVFTNDGQNVVSNCFTPSEKSLDVVLFTNGGELGIDNVSVYKLESVWGEQ